MKLPEPVSRRSALLLLLALFLLGAGIRWWTFVSTNAGSDPWFTVESAQHFRYVRMVATTGSIPELDLRLEWPAGAPTGEDTLFHEYLLGYLYRFLVPAAIPLDACCRIAVVTAAALLPLIIFLILRTVGAGPLTAWLLAAIAAVNLGLIERSYGTLLYHEHFALPFILLHLYYGFRIFLRPDGARLRNILPAAFFLALALYAWKASGFYYQLHLAVLAAFLLLQREPGPLLPALRRYLAASALAAALVGTAASHLRAELFIISVPFIIHTGWAVMLFAWSRRTGTLTRRQLLIALLLPPLVLLPTELSSVGAAAPGTYGHVWAVVKAQLQFGFHKPADPSLLAPEARLYWVPPYTTPSSLRFGNDLGLIVAAGLLAAGFILLRRRTDPAGQLALLWTLVTGLAYLLFFKTITFFLPCLLVLIGAAAARRPPGKWPTGVFLLLFLVGGYTTVTREKSLLVRGLAAAGATAEYVAPAGSVADRNDLLRWLAANTSPADAILCHYGLGSAILASLDRPIILQCYFETPRVREKIFAFANGLFAGEADFARFAGEYQARYYIHSADLALATDPGSYRYLAAAPDSGVAFQCQFAPETLARFSLVYQNDFYRVYAIGGAPRPLPPAPIPLLFQPDSSAAYLDHGRTSDDFLREGSAVAKGMAVSRALRTAGEAATADRIAGELARRYPLLAAAIAAGATP